MAISRWLIDQWDDTQIVPYKYTVLRNQIGTAPIPGDRKLETATFLQRIKNRPNLETLSAAENHYVRELFDPGSREVVVNGEAIGWTEIDEVEVVVSPRSAGPAGWLVRYFVHGEDRYHVGIYFGRNEAILPNITLAVAKYVVQCIAFYAPLPVRYKGPEGLSPVVVE